MMKLLLMTSEMTSFMGLMVRSSIAVIVAENESNVDTIQTARLENVNDVELRWTAGTQSEKHALQSAGLKSIGNETGKRQFKGLI